MSKQPSSIPAPGCDEYDPNNLSVAQARDRIQSLLTPCQEKERVTLRDSLDRVLAEDVLSTINVPPYDNSAMDGYAVHFADLPATGTGELELIGTAFAGNPFSGHLQSGQCVRIMTGAVLPDGADSVIMQEHVEQAGEHIRIGSSHKQAQNVRYRGEDIKAGGAVLHAGKKIEAAELGLLASLGIAEVYVQRRLRIAFFSTGDELRGVGESLEEGQIYDSNRYTLYGLLRKLDVEILDMGVIRDDREAIETAFKQAADTADIIITSGGVSVGEADYVKDTLDKLGTVDFWKIAMKPGKPLAFGKVSQAIFFGLPGNPVSVMATFYQFVLPAVRKLQGEEEHSPLIFQVPCKSQLKKRPGRMDFQRGILSYNSTGKLQVDGTGMQASHILSGMSKANCFIILPADAGDIAAGTLVDVQPFVDFK